MHWWSLRFNRSKFCNVACLLWLLLGKASNATAAGVSLNVHPNEVVSLDVEANRWVVTQPRVAEIEHRNTGGLQLRGLAPGQTVIYFFRAIAS